MSSSHTMPPSQSRLFKPLKVGNMQLQHRVVFPPLTRVRNDDDHAPLPFMEKYYADRACEPGTLLISEATAISHGEAGLPNSPAFVSDAQVEAWRKIIAGVHARGSFYFQQLWGMGRASDVRHLQARGFPYRSSGDVPMPGADVAPTAMTEAEILQTIQDFVDTAKRVVAAGGDGVEIHSAHGYLLDQFLTPAINTRTDRWGGSVENRARLTLAVVRAVSDAIGAERVGVRLSPYATFQGCDKDDDDDVQALYSYLVAELKTISSAPAQQPLAYLSLVEAVGDPALLLAGLEHAGPPKTLDFILEAWDNRSPVLVAGAYGPQTAAAALEHHYQKWDVLVGFGRHFIANPDLVFRIRHGIPLTPYNRATFYINKSEVGYNDYPFSDEYRRAHLHLSQEAAVSLAAVDDKTTSLAMEKPSAGVEVQA